MVTGILVGLANLDNNYDDAFITFRYAYNFATDKGFVYNEDEHVLGITAPLFGLLLGVLGMIFGPDSIPLCAGVVSSLSHLAAGLALFQYGSSHREPLCGFFAGLLYVCNPFLTLSFGGEMPFVTALILWAFVSYSLRHTLLSSFLLSLAILARPDSILAAAVLSVHFVITKRRFPLREFVLMLCVTAPFLVAALVYYKALFPATLAAKLAQGRSGLWARLPSEALFWLKDFTVFGRTIILPDLPPGGRFVVYLTAGGAFMFWRFRFWLPILSWIYCFLLGYLCLGVPFYHWYLVPIVLANIIFVSCIAAGMTYIFQNALGRMTSGLRFAAGVVLVLLWFSPVYSKLQESLQSSTEDATEVMYEKAGKWFRMNTLENASIGYLEIGLLGYYSHRRIVDPLGLLDPAIPPHLIKGDFGWAYRKYRPDFILHTDRFRGPFEAMLLERWFIESYQSIAKIEQSGTRPLIIYKRIPSKNELNIR
ncbi:hypothetical protein L0156_16335 [bacterium]|nr:hypothetical protein [bacterium]